MAESLEQHPILRYQRINTYSAHTRVNQTEKGPSPAASLVTLFTFFPSRNPPSPSSHFTAFQGFWSVRQRVLREFLGIQSSLHTLASLSVAPHFSEPAQWLSCYVMICSVLAGLIGQ